MTDLSASGMPQGPARPSRPPSTRWIDALSALFLAAACLLVLFAASPSLLRAATGSDLFERAPADDLEQPHPSFRSTEDGDLDESLRHELAPEDNPHLLFPRPTDSLDEPPAPHRSRGPSEQDPEEDVPLGSLRIGVAKVHVTLLDQPDGSARDELDAGETVVIVKDAGEWVFVHGKSSKMGWARKRDISPFPK